MIMLAIYINIENHSFKYVTQIHILKGMQHVSKSMYLNGSIH